MVSPRIVAIKENPVQILQRVFFGKIHKSGPNRKKKKKKG
jgi:hypothetical protein